MWTRAELKDNAKKFFKYNYWKMVLVSLVLGFAGAAVAVAERGCLLPEPTRTVWTI